MNLSPIVFVTQTFDVAALFEAVNEFNGAVMFEGKLLGQGADRGRFVLAEAANGQQHLILLRLEALGVSSGIAGTQEEPDAVAQFSEGAVFGGSDPFGHEFIVS